MRILKRYTAAVVLVLAAITLFSCNKEDDNGFTIPTTPSEVLASTPWLTTDAKNSKGEKVELTDPNVINFVGYAYFNSNGLFNMFNLDDSPKMQGDWSVAPDGKTRTIVAKDNFGKTLFTRIVDITVLTPKEFTYRIYPNAEDKSVYYDIIHTPTTHKEPEYILFSKILADTAWETTGAKNQNGEDVALDNQNVAGFVGYAYYNQNGKFTIYSLQDALRMQGDWSVSADGRTRTLTARNNEGTVLFTRVVPITVLNEKEFTYRTYPQDGNNDVYIDIIHTPTTHTEPAK